MPLELKHINFWQSVSWASLHAAVQTGGAVLPQVHHAVMELREAIAVMEKMCGKMNSANGCGPEDIRRSIHKLCMTRDLYVKRQGGQNNKHTNNSQKQIPALCQRLLDGQTMSHELEIH